jgi:2,4-dienoyl-CoA reductase-like NADH-dependent reductase (Old Yellow Enzyme family)
MTTTSALFTPIDIANCTFANRIVVSPMCQYSAEDGTASDWHMMHLGMLSNSGAGLVMLEATAVEPEGRISPGDLGLYSDANEAALARIITACRHHGISKFGIQISHAGRKGATSAPWLGGKPLASDEGGWQTLAPSALPFTENAPPPRSFRDEDFSRVRQAFVDSAKRALRIGFDALELHAAHGYLLHQFLSPITNHRDDAYGGTQERCMRFPLEVFEAVRAVWPTDLALGVRISGSDWLEDGLVIEDAVAFARALRERGCDFLDVTTGALAPKANIKIGPGYQVPFAAEIRRRTGLPVMSVGLIVQPEHAEQIVAAGDADMVALGRAVLDNPRWGWHAAEKLGATMPYPPQYARAAPVVWPGHSHRHAAPDGRAAVALKTKV